MLQCTNTGQSEQNIADFDPRETVDIDTVTEVHNVGRQSHDVAERGL
ncbi:MAG: hypothetical protein ACTSYX_05140 [Candidatus Thorarchaeota archaeon]